MGELDRFAQASPKWMNSAGSTVIGVDLFGSRKVTMKDSSGNEIFTSTNPAYASIHQHVILSTYNNSTANLTASGSFTGSAESTLDCAGIQITLYTTENCLVYIQQSINGTNWDISDVYNYYDHIGNFGITIKAVASYFRVIVTNLNTTTSTTAFRLQSILCPIVEALPRSLTQKGNLKTSIQSLNDSFGFNGQFTPMRDLKVTKSFRLVGTIFGNAQDTNFWTLSASGTVASASISAGICTLKSGTDGNGFAKLSSKRFARFIFAVPNLKRGLFQITDIIVSKNTRRWGPFTISETTPVDGF